MEKRFLKNRKAQRHFVLDLENNFDQIGFKNCYKKNSIAFENPSISPQGPFGSPNSFFHFPIHSKANPHSQVYHIPLHNLNVFNLKEHLGLSSHSKFIQKIK